MKDIHDFRTYNLEQEICRRWRLAHRYQHIKSLADNQVSWRRMIQFLDDVSWMAENPFSKFIGDPSVRKTTLLNLHTLQSLAEQRMRLL